MVLSPLCEVPYPHISRDIPLRSVTSQGEFARSHPGSWEQGHEFFR